MADELVEGMFAKARALRQLADTIEASARQLMGLDNYQTKKKPNSWNVADDIQLILENGSKSMSRDELVRTLVDDDLVQGGDRNRKIRAARQAITLGKNKGYLRLDGEMVHWVPGVYENPRLQKNV